MAVRGEVSWNPRLPASFAVCSTAAEGRGHWSSSGTQTAGFICLLFRSQWLIKMVLYFLFIYLTETEWMIWVLQKKKKKKAFLFLKKMSCYLCDHVGASRCHSFSLSQQLTFCLTFIKAAKVHWHVNFWAMRHLLEQNLETDLSYVFEIEEKRRLILKVKFIYK